MSQLKVVSLNMWNGGRLFAAAREFLVTEQADLYFIQEAYDGRTASTEDRFRTVEMLQAAFPTFHAYFGPAYLDITAQGGPTEDGGLLLSRWPLTNCQNIFPDVLYGEFDQEGTIDYDQFPANILQAQIEWQGRIVTLLNVHGPVNFDGMEDSQRRLAFREAILAAAGSSTILAGDFNVQPQTQTIAGLEARFHSVFGHELTTTFNLRRKDLETYPGYAHSPVDMVFVTPDWQVVSKACPVVDISDHLPLVVELSD